jgi:hypothetical protein
LHDAFRRGLNLVVHEAYYKYRKLSSTSQVLFRDMVLSNATGTLLQSLNEASNISEFFTCISAWPLVQLYVVIEVLDKRRRDLRYEAEIEAANFRCDIQCPREFVRYVHEHNCCECLQSAYNELKTTTKRTSICDYCKELKPAKQIKECSGCKAAFYCSRECQLADYPEHKIGCKRIQRKLPNKPKCVYCREVKPTEQVKVCSDCKYAFYCSRECQQADYPVHKKECKRIQELLIE